MKRLILKIVFMSLEMEESNKYPSYSWGLYKNFFLAGLKLKISCLADNICYLTAASNDISYEEAYSILLGTIIEPEDLLIYLSEVVIL